MINWNKQQVKSNPAVDLGLYLPERLAWHSIVIWILLDVVCIGLRHRWKCGIQNFCPPLKWLNQPHAAWSKPSKLQMPQPDNEQPTQWAAGWTKTFPGSSWPSCFGLKMQVCHSSTPVPFPLHGHKIKGETWQFRENHHHGYLVYHKKVFIEDFQD